MPTAATPPVKFPLIGRFIGGSGALGEWRGGIENLRRTGYTIIHLPATNGLGALSGENGEQRFGDGVYSPPGGVFAATSSQDWDGIWWALDNWARVKAENYAAAGFNVTGLRGFALADEVSFLLFNFTCRVAFPSLCNAVRSCRPSAPYRTTKSQSFFLSFYRSILCESCSQCFARRQPGFYQPAAFTSRWGERQQVDFLEYLQNVSLPQFEPLTPALLGAASWANVTPVGRSAASVSLPLKRRFYHTSRFLSAYSAKFLAMATEAMERNFGPETTTFSNWSVRSSDVWIHRPLVTT